MARINVDDSLFTDARFIALRDEVGEAVAIGKLVISWRIAQNYWIKSELIPIKFWELLNLQVLADFDFAEITENGVYVKGIEENFEWLKQKQASGRKGGLAKASKALAKASTTLANPSTTSFCSSESYPLTLTLTPTLNTNTLVVADKLGVKELHTLDIPEKDIVSCVKTDEFKANSIAESWNTMAKENKLSCVKLPLSKDRVKLLKTAIGEFKTSEDWDDIIWQVPRVKWNLGVNNTGWKANFDWLIQKTTFNYRKMWEGAKRDGLSYIEEDNGNGQHDASGEG